MRIIINSRSTDIFPSRLITGGGFCTWVDKNLTPMCWNACFLEDDNSIRIIL